MTPQQTAFIALITPGAQAAQAAYKVPASVTIAQGIFEAATKDGWGTSPLATKAFNFFGIKAHHKYNPNTYMEFPTHEYIRGVYTLIEDDFEKYADPRACCMDHAQLIAIAPRYHSCMLSLPDVHAFAQQLEVDGYSTTKGYGTQIAHAIDTYKLQQYDAPADVGIAGVHLGGLV